MQYLIAILLLAALCGGWVVFQMWFAKNMPDAPGIERRCDGCTGDASCGNPDYACAQEATGEAEV
ncbi:MAG: hypothetical protein K8E66_01510 [Phycisphaerales bacterium]|nr:hypothetical protein [Phycisphaerales bacterium]